MFFETLRDYRPPHCEKMHSLYILSLRMKHKQTSQFKHNSSIRENLKKKTRKQYI